MLISWKETVLAVLVIVLVSVALSVVLFQTEKTQTAEALRTSGFVDEELPAGEVGASVEAPHSEEFSLIGVIGITIRQTLQIVVPLLITLRVLKFTRNKSRRKRTAARA